MGIRGSVSNASTMAYQVIYNSARQKELTREGRKPVVLFASVNGTELSGSMRCVHDRMVKRGLGEKFDIQLDLRAGVEGSQGMSKQMAYVQMLACADVIICDDGNPLLALVDYPANVKVVLLPHSLGAFEAFGLASAAGKRKGERRHYRYTHVIASGKPDRKHYAKAYGVPESSVFVTGVPRADSLMDEDWQKGARKAFIEAFPQVAGKRVALFAPALRRGTLASGYDFSALDFEKLAQWCSKKGYVLAVKAPEGASDSLEIPAKLHDTIVDVSSAGAVEEILPAANLFITDYSNAIFDAALLGIPMVFYANDLQEHERIPGFFEPYYGFVPGPAAKNFTKLLDLLRGGGEPAKVASFKKKHFAYLDAVATDRVVDLVFGE